MFSKRIRSPARLPRMARAMVLVEAVVASAVIAGAAGLFLVVLSDSALSVAATRARVCELMIASQALSLAAMNPSLDPSHGVTASHAWTMNCAPSATLSSPRLWLLECEARVFSGSSEMGRPAISLRSSFAVPREALSPV